MRNPSSISRHWFLTLLSALATLVVPGLLLAGSVTGLAVFQANTPALASEVNANFTLVAGEIGDNDTRISSLEASSGGNESPILLADAPILAVDGNVNSVFNINLTGDRILGDMTGVVDGRNYLFRVTQDGTGGHDLDFEAGYRFASDPLGVLNGSDAVTVFQFHAKGGDLFLIGSHSDDPVPSYLYFSNSSAGVVHTSRLDGSDLRDVSVGSHPLGLDVDLEGGKIYWKDAGVAQVMYRANLDGTDREMLPIADGLLVQQVEQVALDVANQRLYLGRLGWGMYSFDLDGGDQQAFLLEGNNLFVSGIVIDPTEGNGKIYVCDYQTYKVTKANLDGSAAEVILDGTDGLDRPRGLDLDLPNGKLYVGSQGNDRIYRCNLDGSNPEIVVSAPLAQMGIIRNIALDLRNRKLYWTSHGLNEIRRCDMDDGTGAQTVLGGLNDPWALFVP